MKTLWSVIVIAFVIFTKNVQSQEKSQTVKLESRNIKPGNSIVNNEPGLKIFCHNAEAKRLSHMWKTHILKLNTSIDTYELYEGKTPNEVYEKHEDNQGYWRFSFFSTKKSKTFRINPFQNSCIGVFTNTYNQHQYTMSMIETNVDSWKVAMMVLGILTFWFAQRLSRNPLFYYLCGVTIGVTLSVIILIYFIGKLFPKGKVMYLMMFSGYTMSFYIAQMLWDNAQLIAMQYREWVLWYIFATSLISFIICYRFGPVTNTRTKNIIQWILQISGLVTIFYSSYFKEASTVLCLLILVVYNFPVVFVSSGRKYWRCMFPEQRRLLSDDEYRKEGMRETSKALTGLQKYCSSPECNTWKTVLRLKDPIRFAKFVEGDSHLSEGESLEHDAEITRLIEECEYTDDEFEDDEYSF